MEVKEKVKKKLRNLDFYNPDAITLFTLVGSSRRSQKQDRHHELSDQLKCPEQPDRKDKGN